MAQHTTYVVWPDNTVCEQDELAEFGHMSDDYIVFSSPRTLEQLEGVPRLYDRVARIEPPF